MASERRIFWSASKVFRLLAIGVVAGLMWACQSNAGRTVNLLPNGDLMQGTGDSPADWKSNAWLPKAAVFQWIHSAHGLGLLEIASQQPNDAHWSQTVHLGPGWYYLSADMRSEDVIHAGSGATLYDFAHDIGSQPLYGNTNWQRVGFYLKFGELGGDVRLACRLGGFSSLNTGKAFCRNLSIVRIDQPPTGAAAVFDLDRRAKG